MPYFADDSYISLRYAQRLIEGHGLTWTSGIPVEGYSNLLWTLLMAMFGWVGVDMVFAARFAGIALSISGSYILIKYISKRTENASIIISIVLFFYSFSGTLAVWSIAGLEQPLYAFLALLSLYNFLNFSDFGNRYSLWFSSISLGLLSITRPDGILLTAILASVYLFWNRREIRNSIPNIIILIIFPALFYLGQLAFRLYYYGDYVPNTAYVKVSPSLHYFTIGLQYTYSFGKSVAFLSLLSIISLYYLIKNKNRNSILYIAILFPWFLYLAVISGDIFLAYRHHFYTIVVLMLLLSDGLHSFIMKVTRHNLSKLFYIVFSLGALFYIYRQYNHIAYKAVHKVDWTYNQKTLGLALKDVFGDKKPLIAVDAAGSVPYWSELPALDMLGLNDYHIARNRPKKIGQGFVGHELGDPDYTLAQNPDIIEIHSGTRNPQWYIDSAIMRHPDFEKYTPVDLYAKEYDGYDFTGVLWFNKYSEKVGVNKTNEEIIMPGYLFLPDDTLDVALFIKDKLVRPIKPNSEYVLTLKNNENYYSNIVTHPNGLVVSTNDLGGRTKYTVTNPNDTIINLIYVKATK